MKDEEQKFVESCLLREKENEHHKVFFWAWNEPRPETTPEFDEAFDDAARLAEIKHEKAVLESTKVSPEFRITELRRLESERREIEGAHGPNDERQEIEGSQPPAHDKLVFGWEDLKVAFDGLSRNTIKKMVSDADVKFRRVGRSPALLTSEILNVKVSGSKK